MWNPLKRSSPSAASTATMGAPMEEPAVAKRRQAAEMKWRDVRASDMSFIETHRAATVKENLTPRMDTRSPSRQAGWLVASRAARCVGEPAQEVERGERGQRVEIDLAQSLDGGVLRVLGEERELRCLPWSRNHLLHAA